VLIGLIRHRYGVGVSAAALVALVVANIGTATAEFAGIAAGSELLSRDASVLGDHVVSRAWAAVQAVVVLSVFACVGLLLR
jgi:Mn2+/Fe2+ NRAMP family transporter